MPASFGGVPDSELPAGSVIMWAGLLADIPDGWVLCDGANGTMDLLGRFVNSPKTVDATPGAAGGEDSYTFSVSELPEHDHAGSAESTGAHSHEYWRASGTEPSSSDPKVDDSKSFDGTYPDDIDHRTFPEWDHKHTFSTGNTGGGNATENRPAYYELAFIQKL